MSAGKINEDWLSNVRDNLRGSDCTVEDLVAIATNAGVAEIDAEGSVWIADCMHNDRGGWLRFFNGRWLTQEKIDALCAQIDKGV